MPVIHVDILEGRTLEAKRAYVEALTECSIKHLGCQAQNVTVVLSEISFDHYGRAGKLKIDELAEAGLTVEEYHAREKEKNSNKK
ncbi:tautomerase family protein [Pectobacterium sp. B1J-3]|uniref:tautomerase family protein n=1 Tax=Pectobacterium sp. B1J-3 TaxID=3385371 RepID=UPI0039068150